MSRPEIHVEQIEKGKPFIFTAEVAVKPDVTLGEYKGVAVPVSDAEVTDEEVEAALKKGAGEEFPDGCGGGPRRREGRYRHHRL